MNPTKKNTEVVNDEVEELLRAAEDSISLKLNLNSHTVHASPSDLNPDLDQRFRALKSGSKLTKSEGLTQKRLQPPSTNVKEEDGDDLFARFTALKASLPKPSPSTFPSSLVGVNSSDTSLDHVSKLAGGNLVGECNIDIDEDEDEVERVIRWAVDAARLDPSPPSGDDDDDDDDNNTKDDDDDDYDDSEKSDEDDDRLRRNPKGHPK